MTTVTAASPGTLASEHGEQVSTGRLAQRGRLRADVAEAARIVAPLWPIERFIAVNPMQGLTSAHFDDARNEATRWLGVTTLPGPDVARRAIADGQLTEVDLVAALAEVAPWLRDEPDVDPTGAPVSALDIALADLLEGIGPEVGPIGPRTALERVDAREGTALALALDAEVARWCALLLGPRTARGTLWQAWTALAPHDRRLRRLVGRSHQGRFDALPARADDAVDDALAALGVASHRRVDELRGQLARLPGWAGYARWCDEWAPVDDPAPRLSLVELLAVRLTADALAVEALGGPMPHHDFVVAPDSGPPSRERVEQALRAAGFDGVDPRQWTFAADVLTTCTEEIVGRAVLIALETTHRRQILRRLSSAPEGIAQPPQAQVVCCIDVRSEGLRRRIEAVGPYDTIGFAGFFATAMNYRALGSSAAVPLAPALVTPEIEVREVPDGDVAPASVADRRQRRARAAATVEDAGHTGMAMFALAEAAGWVLGPRALLATLAPGRRPRGASSVAGRVEPDADKLDGGAGLSLEERALVAESALRTMGLTDGFAPLVVLCGHGSTTTANAHAAALDCGACGGNRGGANARAAAAILNDAAVRATLADRGIEIPHETWFVAAEHDTTTDEVKLLEASRVPTEHDAAMRRLACDLAAVGRNNARARLADLPGGRSASILGPARAVRARSADWAQTRPEWGLAGNASFVIGPRDLTRAVDLGGRTFLHSYDPLADLDGTVLETILTAPMVVASWISLGYYGATVDPRVWGAGDKVLHNPVPGIGVLEGLGGDLRPGLPWQSVADEQGARHLPVRLLTLVVAPVERVEAVVARNRVLTELFDGAWVHLGVREPGADPAIGWQLRRPGGGWVDAVDAPFDLGARP